MVPSLERIGAGRAHRGGALGHNDRVTEIERPPSPFAALGNALAYVIVPVALFWAVELLDWLVLDDRLQRQGIQPRMFAGLDGILWAPFLHGNLGHLLANTVPFLILGGLVLTHGRRVFAGATAIVVFVGGGLTWLFARSANHIGASGVVFGFLGYLVGAAVFARSIRAVLTAVVAVLLYGGLVWGFLPRTGVSFEGHLFGFLAGILAARVLHAETDDATPAWPS